MNSLKILIVLTMLLFGIKSFAQTNTILPGIWKGTSICQIKNSPCHDETVVYHISEPDSSNRFHITMNKIVNNKEADMGVLTFTYDSSTQTLISTDTTRNATWNFKLTGKKIEGTLVYKKKLYRIINVIKE